MGKGTKYCICKTARFITMGFICEVCKKPLSPKERKGINYRIPILPNYVWIIKIK